MSNIDLNVDVGQTKTLTFNTKDKYNSEDIVFNIAANDTLADWAKAATKPSYTWNEINDKPTLATVATSGSYEDLTNKPSLNYLPLTGGTMSGAIDMNKFPLKTAGFETVTALPTTNLFVGRKVVMNGIEYTYNGNLWTSQLDPLQKYENHTDGIYAPLTSFNAKSYELQLLNEEISQIPQLLANNSTSLIDHVLQSNEYIYERMDNGTTEWVETSNNTLYHGDKLRFTAWKEWETNVRGLSLKNYPGAISSIYLRINRRQYKMKVTIEYLTYTNTLGDADVNNSANYTWWKVYEKEFPYQQTTWIFPLQRAIYPNSIEGGTDGRYYIHNIRVTIESITAGTTNSTYFTPYVHIYTSKQITPQNVPININYDAKIKPTQTTTTYKTNQWILQYLTQGVHWLRDNKVETNTAATLKSLNIKGVANSTATINASTAENLFINFGGVTPFAVGSSPLRVVPGSEHSNQISLGLQNQYWKEVWAGKYKIPGGTSSQFLKADGSVDSNSYATLDSTGKVPTSQLPSYVDDVVEYTNRASFPATGEKGKIYVDTTENDIYRWTGSTYIKISGIIGAQGEKGAQGFQGYQGKSGVDGLQGATGLQGIQGLQGEKGIQGATGLQGKNGTNGTNGVQGYQGYQGKSGVDGSNGVQGKQGLQGVAGTNGTNGVQGATGAQGTRGYQGYTGAQGTTGLQGTTGARGVQGYKGDTGLQGSAGTNGSNGSRGVQGYQGYTGGTGLQGKQGLQGSAGSNGTNGVQGYQGYQGKSGVDGEDGLQGYRGYQGYTGIQGTTGIQGKNGTNGSRGVQGFQGLQGISGALATNHWYLDKANPEVTNIDGASNAIQLDAISDSIFAKLSTLTNGSLAGRNFIVDCADSDGNAMINDLFGDFSEYNVPNHVRYHFYIRNVSKYQASVKLNWNESFYTNVSHRDGFAPQIILNYGECCKIEFVKFDNSHAWVDVELEDLIYDASTAAASENNEDNAASQIKAYCDNNKLSYTLNTLNEKSHDIQFNLIDIIADICSKLK